MNLNYVISRFKKIETKDITYESIISGEDINREVAFEIGRDIINRENWMLGYGWGTNSSNRIAWFETDDFYRSDPHSIYYSLPPLFGWFGSLAFLLIFIFLIFRLFKKIYMSKYIDFLNILRFGFIFLLIFFLINEYKITALSSPHYFMIIWIWLGMACSILLPIKSMNK